MVLRGTHKNVFCVSVSKACFKRRATAVPNSLIETKCSVARQALLCYMAVARLGFKRCATAVLNSVHKL